MTIVVMDDLNREAGESAALHFARGAITRGLLASSVLTK
jgi:hypothetical protein